MTFALQMTAIMDRLVELNKQYKEMTESKLQTRDITQEFVLRSKLRDLHNACKVRAAVIFMRLEYYRYRTEFVRLS